MSEEELKLAGFKDIPEYEGLYAINSKGKIWSHYKSKFVKTWGTNCDYEQVQLYKDGKRKGLSVHRLVFMAHVRLLEDGEVINHIDSDTKNNHVDNLEACSQKENIQHAIKNGNHRTSGESNATAKLTEKEVCEILVLRYEYNLSLVEIGKRFNVRNTNIHSIVHGKTWNKVFNQYNDDRKKKGLEIIP